MFIFMSVVCNAYMNAYVHDIWADLSSLTHNATAATGDLQCRDEPNAHHDVVAYVLCMLMASHSCVLINFLILPSELKYSYCDSGRDRNRDCDRDRDCFFCRIYVTTGRMKMSRCLAHISMHRTTSRIRVMRIRKRS
jgi:hypothetical protein